MIAAASKTNNPQGFFHNCEKAVDETTCGLPEDEVRNVPDTPA